MAELFVLFHSLGTATPIVGPKYHFESRAPGVVTALASPGRSLIGMQPR